MSEVRNAMRSAIGWEDLERRFVLIDATIKSVDWDKRLCVVTTDEYGDIENVRLRGAGDNNTFGTVSKPTVNSAVVIGFLYQQPNNAAIIKFTAVDMISWCDPNGNEILNVDLTVNPAKIKWNGGNNNGLINLLAALNDVNDVKTDINNLKTAFSTWVVVPQDGGAALKTIAGTWAGQQLAASQRNAWEDTNFKH